MSEYLYSFFKSSAKQLQRQQQLPYPGGSADYAALIGPAGVVANSNSLLPALASASPASASSSDVAAAGSNGSPLVSEAAARYYMKKSLSEKSKQIRFHQCYFNPISCFR